MNKKILVTGFEPFGGDSFNPSQEFLKFLNLNKSKNKIITKVLPVTFQQAFIELESAYSKENFDYVIMTGLAKDRKMIELEKIAINWIDSKIADNDGCVIKASKINQNESDGIFSGLDLDKALKKFPKEHFKISYSAGTYVCNYLYFKVLSELTTNALFVHLPSTKEMTDDENLLTNEEIFNSIFEFIELSF